VLELRRRHAGVTGGPLLPARHRFAFNAAPMRPRTALFLTLPPLLWAANAVVGRLMAGAVPPLTLNFLRWSLAFVILLPLGWRVLRRPRELALRWRPLLMLGLLGVGSYNSLQYLALVTTTPINVTLIAASMPLWMLLVGTLFHGERAGATQLAGAALSLAGVLLVIARGDAAALARIQFVRGDLYVVLAVIAWAFYSWMLVRPAAVLRPPLQPRIAAADSASGVARDWTWAELLQVQMLFGLLGSGLAAGTETLLGAAPIQWNAGVLLALLYVAVGPGLVAYRCWGLGLAEGGPALAAFFSNLTPVFAALMSVALLGEAPRWYHGAAFALIVAGIAVSSLKRPRPART